MLYIHPSSIQGNGVFTSMDLPKGYIVLDYRNDLKDWKLIKCSDLNQYQIDHNWNIMVGKEFCLTNDEVSLLHFMNHSRESNCLWHVEDLYIETSCDIVAGSELLIDYRLEKRSNRVSFPSWI
jgi:hypothetical protein